MAMLTLLALSRRVGLRTSDPQALTISKKINEIRSDITSFNSKFNSDLCVTEVINALQLNCQDVGDLEKSSFAYRMVRCIYDKLKKHVGFECESNNHECARYLNGDSWATYLSFYNQLENSCFYYKLIKFDLELESTFSFLLRNTNTVIDSLELSKISTNELLEYQKLASLEAKQIFNSTLKELENLNDLSLRYQEFDQNLKDSMQNIQSKLNSSDKQLERIYDFIDTKINMLVGIQEILLLSNKFGHKSYFYLYLILTVILTKLFAAFEGIRLFLLTLILVFYFLEVYIIWLLDSEAYLVSTFMLIQVLRVVYSFIFCSALAVKVLCYLRRGSIERNEGEKGESGVKTFSNIDDKISSLLNEVKTGVIMTPIWMKKYMSRIGLLNDITHSERAFNTYLDTVQSQVYLNSKRSSLNFQRVASNNKLVTPRRSD